ncbi:MAG: helix-turn-helix transcriptional regulator, partial [Acidobacteria bacterium]|nr:helix-turn-helix transcriptional regulator [Acidobacteriota bacterium]
MELAHRLQKRRERLSLTQDWVAKALSVSRPMLSYWESGARTPGLKQLRDLAALYGTTPGRLLGEADAQPPSEHLVLFRGLPRGER